MVQKDGGGARGGRILRCFAPARKKPSIRPTGEVAPCVRFARASACGQSGARTAPARNARPRARAPAQDTRELGSRRPAGRRREERNGVERNQMKKRHAGGRQTQLQQDRPAATQALPLAGYRIHISHSRPQQRLAGPTAAVCARPSSQARGIKGGASCPNRLQPIRRAHADHDIA